MFILPSLFFISVCFSVYTILRYKDISAEKSFIFSYLISFIFISTLSKVILFTGIVDLSKIIFIFFFTVCSAIILRQNQIIKTDLKKIFKFDLKFRSIYFLIFIYLLVQSIFLPPSNFDSLAYHIQRNYLFINENSIYPILNAHYGNQVFQPLNSDILFFIFAIFKSNFFMNIYSLFSFFVILIIIYKSLIFLKIENNHILTCILILFSMSAIVLSMLSTKNDIIVASFALSIIYLFFNFLKNDSRIVIYLLIITIFYSCGIKWNFILIIFSFIPVIIYYSLKKKKLIELIKYSIFLIPLFCLIGPFEIIYMNLLNGFGPTGPEAHLIGHSNPDGLSGAISNYIRILISLIDITFPIQYFNIDIINNSIDNLVNFLLLTFYEDNKLGIANNLKWLNFNSSYNLKPHSDYTGYSIIGLIITLYSIFYMFNGENNKLKTLSIISFLNIFLICYFFTWQPWILRFLMFSMILNLIIFTEYIKYISYEKLKFVNFFCILIFMFNILTNIPQPLIKHSETPSWLNVFNDREKYQSLSIPELNKINNLVNLIPKNKKVILIMKNGGSQTPYEIMRKTDNYYVFVDKEFNRFFIKEYLNKKIKIDINNYDYLINFTDEKIKIFKVISKRDNKNFEILKI